MQRFKKKVNDLAVQLTITDSPLIEMKRAEFPRLFNPHPTLRDTFPGSFKLREGWSTKISITLLVAPAYNQHVSLALHLEHIRHPLENPGNLAQATFIADNAHRLLPAMKNLPAHTLRRDRRKLHIRYNNHQSFPLVDIITTADR
jgi:hypothetical protein